MLKKFFYIKRLLSTVLLLSCLIGCQPNTDKTPSSSKLQVLATTTLVADLVSSIGGEHIHLQSLMGPGTDPHLYKASASDLDKLKNADIVFYNGLHLEGRMQDIFDHMAAQKKAIYAITANIPPSNLFSSPSSKQYPDPHVWFDPTLWATGIDIVVSKLSQQDPANASTYIQNGQALQKRYEALDTWAKYYIDNNLPLPKRILVTSHDAFNYFGKAYGFKVIGVQGISTITEAGLADITKTIDFIKENQIKAIFVETSVPHAVIERIAQDAQVKIGGELYSDALGQKTIPPSQLKIDASTYEGMMRYNITTIVEALR